MVFKEVILGCSPFTLGYQFGHRSRLYELDFSNQPENIVEVINKVHEFDVNNIMFKVNKDLENAINMSINGGNDWKVTAFTDCNDIDGDLELFSQFDTKTVILSGDFVDKCIEEANFEVISEYLTKISDCSFVPAIETRTPFKNLPVINDSTIKNDFETIMIPLNFYGYMMDCNFFSSDNREVFSSMVKKLDKNVIANRTLATGILKPKEAYDFLGGVDYVDSVCVGIAKTSEAEETLSYITTLME